MTGEPTSPPRRPRRTFRAFVWFAAAFGAAAVWDLSQLATRSRSGDAADLVMHLAMALTFGAIWWAGDAPTGSSRARLGRGVCFAALAAMIAAFAWKLRGG